MATLTDQAAADIIAAQAARKRVDADSRAIEARAYPFQLHTEAIAHKVATTIYNPDHYVAPAQTQQAILLQLTRIADMLTCLAIKHGDPLGMFYPEKPVLTGNPRRCNRDDGPDDPHVTEPMQPDDPYEGDSNAARS